MRLGTRAGLQPWMKNPQSASCYPLHTSYSEELQLLLVTYSNATFEHKQACAGGGASVAGNVLHRDGQLHCQACSGNEGGCLHVAGAYKQLRGAFARFTACSALSQGGALKSTNSVMLGGSTAFQNCTSGTQLTMANAAPGYEAPNPAAALQSLV